MAWFNFRKKETRNSLENPQVPISSEAILQLFGISQTEAGVSVSTETALGIPAIWAAVNVLAGTLAGLPLHVYKKSDKGRERVEGGIASVLHDAVNDEMSSFEWRKGKFDGVFTKGRGLTYIERNSRNEVVNLWPLEADKTTIERVNSRKVYVYRGNKGVIQRYAASEIIDIPFMLKPDGCGAYSPIVQCKDALGLAIAATNYASKFFQNGGIPPFVIEGEFQTPGALERGGIDFEAAVRKAAKEKRQALMLPRGLSAKQLGSDPEKTQMEQLQRFCIEQIARIYQIPPAFLQDLTHGTFSNTEQQYLHFVKHSLKRWVEQFEQELNLKLFGRVNAQGYYAELNLDGLLRGDFATRMEGYSKAIQNALMTPAEARERENLPAKANSDNLLVQGATVPLGSQPTQVSNGN